MRKPEEECLIFIRRRRGLGVVVLSRILRAFEGYLNKQMPHSNIPRLLRETAGLCYAEYERVLDPPALRESAIELWRKIMDNLVSDQDRE